MAVQHVSIFLRNDSLVLPWFGQKRAQNDPKIRLFGFFEKICHCYWYFTAISGKFWVLSYGSKCCQPIKLQDSLKCNILKKKWMMKFTFCMQRNIKVFYKLILFFWVSVTKHAQRTQNKFAYLCNISIKAWGWKQNADKHES